MIQRLITIILGTAFSVVAILAVNCQQRAKSDAEKELEEKSAMLEELAQKRETREKELAAMDIAGLAGELTEESAKGVEPYNSMPYKELTSRGENIAAELKSLLKDSTRASFLGLLTLRQISKPTYSEFEPSFRINVLINALKTSQYFNAWGLPHIYWEDAAKAIVEEGERASGPLKALLKDQRPAPMWGSQEVVEYRIYNYRVRDYAWALLMEIQGEKVEIPMDSAARDSLISVMK